MEQKKKEATLNRIISGCIRCKIYNSVFVFKHPDRQTRYIAEEVYSDALLEASYSENMPESEILKFLLENELWKMSEQVRLDEIPKKIDDLKVELFNSVLKSATKKRIREDLAEIRKEQNILLHKRHSYDQITCEGYAALVKTKYLISNSLFDENNNKIVVKDERIIDSILHYISDIKINEAECREMARTEPWRQYWSLSKHEVFGIPVVDMSEEQKSLCVWSRVYDNVYESQDCPVDSVIEDDDMLDGWFIVQRRKRESDINKKEVEDLLTNDKIRNSKEIFIIAETHEDAVKIDAVNSAQAKMIKVQRNMALEKSGIIEEQNLPDVKGDLMMMQAASKPPGM